MNHDYGYCTHLLVRSIQPLEDVMTYKKLADGSQNEMIRGTHYASDSDYVYFVSSAADPTFDTGKLLRIRHTPYETIEKTQTIKPNVQIDLDSTKNTGARDVLWSGSQLMAMNGAKLYKFPASPSGSLDLASLLALPYGTASIVENAQTDTYGAVQTAAGNYTFLRISKVQGDPNSRSLQWTTYKPSATVQVVGRGYINSRDVVLSADFAWAYVSADDENGVARVLRVPNTGTFDSPGYHISLDGAVFHAIDNAADASGNPVPLIATGQIAIDPANSEVIYVVDATGLWRIEIDIDTTKVVDIPNGGGKGLLIDDNQCAVVSDTLGNLYRVQLDSPAPVLNPLDAAIANLGGPSGFLTWADETKTSFYAAALDPTNKVRMSNLVTGESSDFLDVANWSPSLRDPTSVEVLSPSLVFVATNGEVGTFDRNIVGNALVLGIGHVPFDYIIQDPMSPDRGRADTTPTAGYFYQINKVPFAGNLFLKINHPNAYAAGLRHFRVTLTKVGVANGRVIDRQFENLLWTAAGGPPKFMKQTVTPTVANTPPGTPAKAYAIRSPNEIWYNPQHGALVDTRITEHGLHEIKVEFFDQNGILAAGQTTTYVVLLDNNKCSAKLELPRMGNPPPTGYPVVDCGCITYASKDDKVELDFVAAQKNGEGTYSLQFWRGSVRLGTLEETGMTTPLETVRTKSTTSIASSPTFKVGHLLGDCNIANILVTLSVPSRAIDGYSSVGIYRAETNLRFALVPDSVPMSSPWVDPGG